MMSLLSTALVKLCQSKESNFISPNSWKFRIQKYWKTGLIIEAYAA